MLLDIELIKRDMELNNSDCVVSIFGKEGSGKSLFTLNLATYFDKTYLCDWSEMESPLPKNVLEYLDLRIKNPSWLRTAMVIPDPDGKRITISDKENSIVLAHRMLRRDADGCGDGTITVSIKGSSDEKYKDLVDWPTEFTKEEIHIYETYDGLAIQNRFAQTFEDFARNSPNVPTFRVMWWDEAHRFSKRGTFDTNTNRTLLKYFQDIRGARRIYLLCYPELREMDRKVLQRSRLYFETVKKADDYFVRGWRQSQIDAKMRSLRVFSKESRASAWIDDSGQPIPKKPVIVFRVNMKGIELVHDAYKERKAGSLRRSDEELRQFGIYSTWDVANEVVRTTDLKFNSATLMASNAARKAYAEGWFDNEHLDFVRGNYKIKTKECHDKLLEFCKEHGANLKAYKVDAAVSRAFKESVELVKEQ